MNKKETIQQLNDSLEMEFYRNYLIIAGVLILIFDGIFCLRFRDDLGIYPVVLTTLFMLPFLGFYLWRIFRIYRKADQYIFCKAKLSAPHQAVWGRGGMYFTVVIDDPEYGAFAADTHAIFQSYGMMEPLLENYINKTVTIGYNRDTEMVVVIG